MAAASLVNAPALSSRLVIEGPSLDSAWSALPNARTVVWKVGPLWPTVCATSCTNWLSSPFLFAPVGPSAWISWSSSEIVWSTDCGSAVRFKGITASFVMTAPRRYTGSSWMYRSFTRSGAIRAAMAVAGTLTSVATCMTTDT